MTDLSLFHFIRPYCLLLFIPVIAALFFVFKHKLSRTHWDDVCDKELMPFILDDSATPRQYWSLSAISFASILSIIALAGPTWEKRPTPIFNSNQAVVIVLDLSLSMNATDIKPSRLIRARYKIEDILQKRKEGLTGLLVYAGDAFTVTPLTDDIQTIKSQLNALTTDIMPVLGSNTVAAIQQAVDLLKQSGHAQGNILLITDEVQSKLSEAILLTLDSYQLSILGVGTAEGAPIPLGDNASFLKDRQGNIVIPKFETRTLKQLAAKGNGIYRTLSHSDHDIDAFSTFVENPIDQTATKRELTSEQWNDLGPWVLLFVLPLVLLYFRKGLLVIPLIVLQLPQEAHAFEWQDLWQSQDQQAHVLFDNKDYENAEKKFQDPNWKATAQYKAENYQQASELFDAIDTSDGHYNKANALAKMGKLEEALSSYQHALERDPNNKDAQFNKDLVEKALKEQEQDQKKKQGDEGEPQENPDKKDEQEQQGKQDEDQQKEESDKKKESDDAEKKKDDQAPSEQESKQDPQQSKEDKKTPENKQPEEKTQAEKTEQERANEQWLQRIPDDPAGLLQRKFKYQYGQRKHDKEQEQLW